MVGSKTSTLWIRTKEYVSRKIQKGRTTLKWTKKTKQYEKAWQDRVAGLSRMVACWIEFHRQGSSRHLLTNSACCPWRVLAVCGLHCPPSRTWKKIAKDFPNKNPNAYEVGECIPEVSNGCDPCYSLQNHTYDWCFWHFFAKYLFILENKVWQFEISFSRISRVDE